MATFLRLKLCVTKLVRSSILFAKVMFMHFEELIVWGINYVVIVIFTCKSILQTKMNLSFFILVAMEAAGRFLCPISADLLSYGIASQQSLLDLQICRLPEIEIE